MVNVQARVIHVGDRFEELSPLEKVEALVAADGYQSLLDEPTALPPLPEEAELGKMWVVVGGGAVITAMTVFGGGAVGGDPTFALFGLVFAAVLLWIPISVYSKMEKYRSAETEQLPACVVRKDYVKRREDESVHGGAYEVSFVTLDGSRRTAELTADLVDMVMIHDVGVAAVRLGRLVDFKRLKIVVGGPRSRGRN